MAFFTLQGIRFTADVLFGKINPDTNQTAHFLLFYPRLAMGPVQSYSEHSEMCGKAVMCSQNLGEGLGFFIKGLAMKTLLADMTGVIFSSFYSGNDSDQSIIMTWTSLLAFTLQLYFTVAGYSEMAKGAALCYGFRLPDSYGTKILSGNISEFGSEWNKTVTGWFKGCFSVLTQTDKWQSVIGITLAWTLMGCWYRPVLPAIIWGAWMGLWIGLHQYLKNRLTRIPTVLEAVILIVVTFLGWAMFSAQSLGEGLSHIGLMIGSSGKLMQQQDLYFLRSGGIILIAGIYFASGHLSKLTDRIRRIPALSRAADIVCMIIQPLLLILCTAMIISEHTVLI